MTGSGARAQVNIRLKPREAEILSAVAFLNATSAAEVVRPVVEAYLSDQQNDPAVRAALEIRKQRDPHDL